MKVRNVVCAMPNIQSKKFFAWRQNWQLVIIRSFGSFSTKKKKKKSEILGYQKMSANVGIFLLKKKIEQLFYKQLVNIGTIAKDPNFSFRCWVNRGYLFKKVKKKCGSLYVWSCTYLILNILYKIFIITVSHRPRFMIFLTNLIFWLFILDLQNK